ncbi:molybdopterin-dependent oxidoreductase [Candidatus Leptofilum sp.]|uniref:molybdopterin-dependent oxidoreductase n=1 Tax=Candidatus Leptofilum sp. TaxID=3241576 RepID=UPI003B58EB0A
MLRKLSFGALVGLLLTVALTAVHYLVSQLVGTAFLPFDFFNWMTRVLPGDLITFGIDMMIDTMLALGLSVVDLAKTAERASAVLQFVGMTLVLGAIIFGIWHLLKLRRSRLAGLIVGAIVGLPLLTISQSVAQLDVPPLVNGLWLFGSFLLWGWLLGVAYGRLFPTATSDPESAPSAAPANDVQALDRRRFLIQLGASTAVLTVAGTGIGATLARAERARISAGGASIGSGDIIFPNANDPIIPAPGTRLEYTPVSEHYQVFLQTEPTIIEEDDWDLPITGLVDNPRIFTLQQFRDEFESFDQFVTLTCISGRVGTGLISTTKWTGVSAQDVLEAVGVQPEAKYLYITSGDGFYETVDLELIRNDRRIMFCYAWDDKLLPKDHGFPLRIWIPDRYGMKQPKWIVGVEVTDEYQPGYWVERNWSKEAIVRTTSVIDTVAVDSVGAVDGQQVIPIGGIAYSGARGIGGVEVRVDGGDWQPAQLRTPLSETTWVIWRYDWAFTEGDHLFEVRCTEADGTSQIEESNPNRPDGSTGIHSFEQTV